MILYEKLFLKIAEKDMSKTEFRKAVGIGQNRLAKLGKNEFVSIDIIVKICNYFNCNIGEIIDVVSELEDRK